MSRHYTSSAELLTQSKTAIVVIDMQNDFCTAGGAMDLRGQDLSMVQAMIPKLSNFLSQCSELNKEIIYIRMQHDDQHRAGPLRFRQEQMGIASDYLQEGTWGFDFCAAIRPQNGDKVITKYRYSAFFSDDFLAYLEQQQIETLVLTGVATNVCVESTAREAYMRDYYVVVAEDCVAAYSQELHETALVNIGTFFGQVLNGEQLIDLWK